MKRTFICAFIESLIKYQGNTQVMHDYTRNMFRKSIIFFCMICLTSCSIKSTIDNAEKAVFTIYTYDKFGAPNGIGSGFFIDKTGIGLTNYHVLDGAVKAYIKTYDEQSYEIKEILMSDKNKDIAKFKINNVNNKKVPFLTLSSSNYERGDEIIVIGSPLDLTNSVTMGIISALRADSKYGDVIQISAPISPGNSGSPVLTKSGKVIGIATYNRIGGQNLNFAITAKDIDQITSNDFEKYNGKFNLRDNFVILNIPSNNGTNIILNAIEFSKKQTIVYFTYININLLFNPETLQLLLDADFNNNSCIIDNNQNKHYYMASSSINIDNNTQVELGDSFQFQAYFPTIEYQPENIDIKTQYLHFENIDLGIYRNNLSADVNLYKKQYAISQINNKNLEDAQSTLFEILKNNTTDIECLNGLGLIAKIKGNKFDAISYFNSAIEENQLNASSYCNRATFYMEEHDYKSALADITKAIEVSGDHPCYYYIRASMHIYLGDYNLALSDVNKILSNKHIKFPTIFQLRCLIYMKLNKIKAAMKDLETYVQLTDDKEAKQILRKMRYYY